MKTHAEQELLSAFVDGELTEREQVTVEAHLASCSDCRSVLTALRATLADLASLPEAAPDEQTSWALRAAISKERRLGSRARRWYLLSGGAAAALVGILAFALATGPSRDAGGPSAAAGGPALTFAAVDYSETTAREVLLRYGGTSADTQFAAPLSKGGALPLQEGQGGTGSSGEGTTGSRAGLADAALNRRLDECVRSVTASTQTKLSARHFEAALFEGDEVFLLVFDATAAKRIELWVVRRADCRPVFFAQTRA